MQLIVSATSKRATLLILALLLGAAAFAGAFLIDLLGLGGREGGVSGFGANQAALALAGLTIILSAFASWSPSAVRADLATGARGLLLVAAAALAVAFVSDLLFTARTIPVTAKALALTAVLAAVLLLRLTIATTSDAHVLDGLRRANLGAAAGAFAAYAAIAIQLGLLVLLTGQLQLENQAFYHSIMLLVFYGFLVHALLPGSLRLPFFLFISLMAIVGILGAGGAWLIAIGLALIALAHVPNFKFQISNFKLEVPSALILLLLLAALLALLRAGRVANPVPAAVWPILGSIFMFRLIIYLYDLRHSKRPRSFWRTLSYFFLLPNIVFPFFPVVDYDTFGRTYYNDDPGRIYQKGITWIFRGVVQLLLYRVVNYYLVIAPADVSNVGELVQFAVTNFALYIRITGQFHLIIGLLHLFGFNLPETNHRYFLSSSFTDLWRRANIYWKDFMQKIFYYPAYFRLSKFKTLNSKFKNASLVLAAVLVFIVTWFLHAYQWFWLRGAFLFTSVDITFWTILGILVIATMLYESNRGRKRSLAPRVWTLRQVGAEALRVAAVFSTIAVLWSLWSSESIAAWLRLWSIGFQSLASVAGLLLAFLAIALVLGGALWFERMGAEKALLKLTQATPTRTAVSYSAVILGLFLVANPIFYNRLPAQAQAIMADLTVARLSDRDAELLLRGYYEDLVGVDRFNADLWEAYTKRPADWPTLHETEAARSTSDFRLFALNPSVQIVFHNATLTTNQWGFRDKEYDLVPPPETYRIALVGPSFVMGSGVADDEVFEWALEDRLNESGPGAYEILNFAVPGHSALQELYILETEALRFRPDAIFFVGHQLEKSVAARNLAHALRVGAEIPYDYLADLGRRAGVTAGMSQSEAERLLRPYQEELVSWTYERIAALAAEHRLQPVWIFLPTFEGELELQEVAELERIAQEAGFVTLNLHDVFQDANMADITVAAWDLHPNAAGHRLIAERLYRELVQSEVLHHE